MAYIEKKKERRIRDKQRMKQKSIYIAHLTNRMRYWDESEACNAFRDDLIKRAIIHADYIAVCSCTQCGNPRKKLRGKSNLTLQEIKFIQSHK